MEIIKIASSFHGASMVKRTFGDDKWYKKSGKLEVKELKDYMPNECIQVWKINSSGDSLRIKWEEAHIAGFFLKNFMIVLFSW